jgi:DNA polymerase-3 subunit delta|uniref:DNA-directed DNA polymerase n=1 Tax=Desulfobacca acetoxidans TaxID=60893 RepID=A0A7C5AKZ6_9BACT
MFHPLLERQLKDRQLRPLYLFYGEEEFLAARALRALEQALTQQTGEAPTKVIREAFEVELGEFFAQARTATLWGASQLMVLRRVETYPVKALAAVTAYLEHPAPRTLVVLYAPSLKTREVEQHAVWGRLAREGAALGFFRLRENELIPWLTAEAKRQGKILAPEAARRLVEMVGDNLGELHQELQKLILFAGPDDTLTPQQVSQLASHSRSYNIFALVEALGEAKATRRLAALDHLLDLGEPPARILVMLARQLRLLMRYKEKAPHTSPGELSKILGVPPGLLKRLGQQAEAFSLKALKRRLALLHQADLSLKTSAGNPRVWLEWVLMQMGPGV